MIDRMTTMKSKTFQPFVKKYWRSEIIFSRHSPLNMTMNTMLIFWRTSSCVSDWSSVSTIMVTMLSHIRTIITISNACFVVKSKMYPWSLFWKRHKVETQKHILGAMKQRSYMECRLDAVTILITHRRSRNRFLWFLWPQLFHGIIVFLLFFSHEDILTS